MEILVRQKRVKDILVDMDGVITKTTDGYNRVLARMFPELPIFPYEKTTTFYIEKLYSQDKETQKKLDKVWRSKGLFLSLEPINGAIEALQDLVETGNKVRICTAPYPRSKYCENEKKQFVNKFLGREWLDRLIITRNKTWVRGDALIDDKPDPENVREGLIPTWKHYVFISPWNVHVTDKPRLNWHNYKEVLEID